MNKQKIGPRELALRAQREREAEALERWANDKRRAARRKRSSKRRK